MIHITNQPHMPIEPHTKARHRWVQMMQLAPFPTTPPPPFSETYYRSDRSGQGIWTEDEHARFLEALSIFQDGPWKRIAEYVGTRNVRQTMTHAQKYRQKAARHLRGLRSKQAFRRTHEGHRIGNEYLDRERFQALNHLLSTHPNSPARVDSPASSVSGSPPASPVRHIDDAKLAEAVSINDAIGILREQHYSSSNVMYSEPSMSLLPSLPIKLSYINSESTTYTTDLTSSPCSTDTQDWINDLENCPSLEECAVELFELLT